MGLGLQGAYGLQGGFDALAALIAERKKDELLAQAEADKQRQFAIQDAQNQENEQYRRMTFAGLEADRKARDEDRDAARASTDTARQDAAAERAKSETRAEEGQFPIGYQASALDFAKAQATGAQGLFRANPIETVPMQGPYGLVGKLGGTPPATTPVAPGTPAYPDDPQKYTYLGNAEQQRKAAEDKQRRQDKRDAAQAKIDAANKPIQLYRYGPDGTPIPTGQMARGGKILGSDPTKLDAADQQMKSAATQLLPQIQTVRNMADALDQKGLLGPIATRWADLVAGNIGAGDVVAGDPASARLLGKFLSEVNLMETLTLRAHGGMRAAASPELLRHMNNIEGGAKDFDTYMGSLDGIQTYMENYAAMGGLPPPIPKPTSERARPGPGLINGPAEITGADVPPGAPKPDASAAPSGFTITGIEPPSAGSAAQTASPSGFTITGIEPPPPKTGPNMRMPSRPSLGASAAPVQAPPTTPIDPEQDFNATVQRITARMAALGHPVKVISGRRTADQQASLYAQGRTAPGSIVTNADGTTSLSNHQKGLAVDFAFPGEPDWDLLGAVAKEEGAGWGGNWKSLVDKPHVEYLGTR